MIEISEKEFYGFAVVATLKQRFTSSTAQNELIIEILFDVFFLHERVAQLVKCIYPQVGDKETDDLGARTLKPKELNQLFIRNLE